MRGAKYAHTHTDEPPCWCMQTHFTAEDELAPTGGGDGDGRTAHERLGRHEAAARGVRCRHCETRQICTSLPRNEQVATAHNGDDGAVPAMAVIADGRDSFTETTGAAVAAAATIDDCPGKEKAAAKALPLRCGGC